MHSEGSDKLFQSISWHFVHPQLKKTAVELINNCDTCKKMKIGHQQQGQLASCIATIASWEEVHVDCIGNWSFKISKKVFLNI